MRAVHVTRLDGPKAVEIVDLPEPEPGADQVLIDVHAAGVAFPDVLLTRGLYQIKPEPPFVPGSEVAGVVRSAPEGSGFAPGDRVAAFPAFGGFAERVAVDARLVFALPDRLSFESGAALPMNYLTVHFALSRRGRLRADETVLVHGAAGGVGTAAIQYARALGARVIAVVSSDAKAEVARRAGAHDVVPVDGFRQAVDGLTGGRGVDLVVDPVGGDRFTDSLRSLATEGRLLVIGFTGGEIPTVRVNRLLLNNIEVIGASWGGFWLRRPDYLREQWNELLPHLEAGRPAPPLGATYALDDTADALAELDERRALGKVVVRVR
ncbi:NADPH:quinone oxidoreductase family protein [Streptomyces specialis]|uniref:NADPH:quinone oxidoreductase family protein n=1 Tax=Streptomyces specialis TaxID=498367 RepID=UPI00073E7F8B|nr:NADPH:quinone oxidoreductase family protein [Streptomyces specialis]